MKRFLCGERIDIDTNSVFASKEWTHWFQAFQNFLAVLPANNLNKLTVLTNLFTPKKYDCLADCKYEQDICKAFALY